MNILILLTIIITSFQAYAGELWNGLQIDAYLDKEGELLVTEKHSLILNGNIQNLNKQFPNSIKNQKLTIISLFRSDVVTNKIYEYRPGDLSHIGNYSIINNKLIWVIGNNNSPTYKNTPVTFILKYKIDNVLQSKNNTYILKHIFGQSNRSNNIKTFSFRIKLAPIWIADKIITDSISIENMPPLDSYSLNLSLSKRAMTEMINQDNIFDKIISCKLNSLPLSKILESYFFNIPPNYFQIDKSLTFSFRSTKEDKGEIEISSGHISPVPIMFISKEESKKIGFNTSAIFQDEFNQNINKLMNNFTEWMKFTLWGIQIWHKTKKPFRFNFDNIIKGDASSFSIKSSNTIITINKIIFSKIEQIIIPESLNITISSESLNGVQFTVKVENCTVI